MFICAVDYDNFLRHRRNPYDLVNVLVKHVVDRLRAFWTELVGHATLALKLLGDVFKHLYSLVGEEE